MHRLRFYVAFCFSGYYQRIVDSLKGKHHSLKVATSQDEDLVALHYSSNRRVAPIVLIAEPGWVIGTNKASVLGGRVFLLQDDHSGQLLLFLRKRMVQIIKIGSFSSHQN